MRANRDCGSPARRRGSRSTRRDKMPAGNRIELKKVPLKPVSVMANAATLLDRVDGDMQEVIARYTGRMMDKRERIKPTLRDVPIPADAKVSAARTQMSRSDYEMRNE